MTVGRLQVLCWTVFVIMCLGGPALMAAGAGATGVPDLARYGLALAGGILWWGPFAYAMYLALVVLKRGDARLVKRGIHGTAVVLEGHMTGETIQTGGYEWEGSRVYKYKLRVTLPGKDPYDTHTSICVGGLQPGLTIPIAAAPHNRKRVTIDVVAAQKQYGRPEDLEPDRPVVLDDAAADRISQAAAGGGGGGHHHGSGSGGPSSATNASTDAGSSTDDSELARLEQIEKLSDLHRKGALSDEEFATEKSRILGTD